MPRPRLPVAPRHLRRPKETTGSGRGSHRRHRRSGSVGVTALGVLLPGRASRRCSSACSSPGPQRAPLLTASQYNQIIHDARTTMVFLLGMPLSIAFATILVAPHDRRPRRRVPAPPTPSATGCSSPAACSSTRASCSAAPERRMVRLHPADEHPARLVPCPVEGPDFWEVGIVMLGIGSTTAGDSTSSSPP